MVLEKAPALGIIEEDVHHSAVHVSNLTAICPKFHAAQQRHTSVPRILEGQINLKVPATASVVGRWRDEEDAVGFYVYCTNEALYTRKKKRLGKSPCVVRHLRTCCI